MFVVFEVTLLGYQRRVGCWSCNISSLWNEWQYSCGEGVGIHSVSYWRSAIWVNQPVGTMPYIYYYYFRLLKFLFVFQLLLLMFGRVHSIYTHFRNKMEKNSSIRSELAMPKKLPSIPDGLLEGEIPTLSDFEIPGIPTGLWGDEVECRYFNSELSLFRTRWG